MCGLSSVSCVCVISSGDVSELFLWQAMIGETQGPAAAVSSNKAKKKCHKRNKGKTKQKDERRSDVAENSVFQVQFTCILCCHVVCIHMLL